MCIYLWICVCVYTYIFSYPPRPPGSCTYPQHVYWHLQCLSSSFWSDLICDAKEFLQAKQFGRKSLIFLDMSMASTPAKVSQNDIVAVRWCRCETKYFQSTCLLALLWDSQWRGLHPMQDKTMIASMLDPQCDAGYTSKQQRKCLKKMIVVPFHVYFQDIALTSLTSRMHGVSWWCLFQTGGACISWWGSHYN